MTAVSVIIPVYNTEKFLKRCLDSVCNQTLKDIEIICINDCSLDSSLNILQDYAEYDNRIRIINFEQNKGVSIARNKGIESAIGEYLGFVDSDDSIDLDFYEKLYNKAVETNSDIVKGDLVQIYSNNSKKKFDLNRKIKESGSVLCFVCNFTTAIYKNSIIQKNNIKFLKDFPIAEDALFLNEVCINSKSIELIDDALYYYFRREDSSDSKKLSFKKIKAAIEIFGIIFNNIKNSSMSNKGAKFAISHWFSQMLLYPFRVEEKQALEYVVMSILEYYRNATYFIDENLIMRQCDPLLEAIKQNNFNDLLKLYMKFNTPQKLFINKMRQLHKNNINKEKK